MSWTVKQSLLSDQVHSRSSEMDMLRNLNQSTDNRNYPDNKRPSRLQELKAIVWPFESSRKLAMEPLNQEYSPRHNSLPQKPIEGCIFQPSQSFSFHVNFGDIQRQVHPTVSDGILQMLSHNIVQNPIELEQSKINSMANESGIYSYNPLGQSELKQPYAASKKNFKLNPEAKEYIPLSTLEILKQQTTYFKPSNNLQTNGNTVECSASVDQIPQIHKSDYGFIKSENCCDSFDSSFPSKNKVDTTSKEMQNPLGVDETDFVSCNVTIGIREIEPYLLKNKKDSSEHFKDRIVQPNMIPVGEPFVSSAAGSLNNQISNIKSDPSNIPCVNDKYNLESKCCVSAMGNPVIEDVISLNDPKLNCDNLPTILQFVPENGEEVIYDEVLSKNENGNEILEKVLFEDENIFTSNQENCCNQFLEENAAGLSSNENEEESSEEESDASEEENEFSDDEDSSEDEFSSDNEEELLESDGMTNSGSDVEDDENNETFESVVFDCEETAAAVDEISETFKTPKPSNIISNQCKTVLAHLLGAESESDSCDSDDASDTSEDHDSDYDCEVFTVNLEDDWGLSGGLHISNIVTQCPFQTHCGDDANNETMLQLCESSLPVDNKCEKDYLEIANEKWNSEINKEFVSNSASPARVKFSDNVTVHPMVTWSYAYKKSRRGPWEQHARDRMRFKRRIEEAESILSNVFDPDHRNKMYFKLQTNLLQCGGL